MSNARKLQTEIDRVMKKVDEGAELFDEIWLKVKNADTQNLKEKHEVDLKKEIKKLQRQRDQIKTWIGSSDVKDKDALIEARKLIETKMEQFKICEKETKTKTYSKEGLAREDKLDPVEEAKLKTTEWLAEYVGKFQELVEEKDFEIEKLSSGKGKKSNKHQIEEMQGHIANHKFHISRLEGIIRLVNNDVMDVEKVDALKEDLDYYLDSCYDEDYMMAYDQDFFYESLGLDELDVVNVDRLTQATSTSSKKSTDDATSQSSKGSRSIKSTKASTGSVIPLTIGRARSRADKKAEKERQKEENDEKSTPSKKREPQPSPATTNRVAPAPAPPQGASMAAILKRETEQQEKERQKQIKQQQEQLRQQQLKQQQEQLRQQEALRQQQQQQQAQQEALQRQQQQQQEEALRQQQTQQQAQQEAAAKRQAQQRAEAEQKAQAIQSQQQQQQQQQPQQQPQGGQSKALELLSSGPVIGNGLDNRSVNSADLKHITAGHANATAPAISAGVAPGSTYLTALNESSISAPGLGENERSRQYTPQNPYPTPASYPATPSAIFDNPAVFEKLGTDCLFFIFYYAQGTYQQYLAARELKKQSWRFHKKYMTWFQRHEEPKITTDEYEQGTYVYFDYETGWCTRIKQDFCFEYSYLEDSLQ